LLLCDAGEHGNPWKVAEVAEALGVSTRTIGVASASMRKA
jgi:hypothetical protein